MAQKEIWFTCPTCARPIRVSGKFIGAEFVHPACGATVRAPDPAKGREEVELVAPPPAHAAEGMKPAKIEDLGSSGLFVPRRLREGGGEVPPEAELPDDDEGVHELAEKIARALIKNKSGKGILVDPDEGVDLIEDVEDEVEASQPEGSKTSPLSQKISHLASGKAPVDPTKLKEQFNKSLDVLKGDAPEPEEGDVLDARRALSSAHEEYVVKQVTPWEADEGARGGDGGHAGSGGRGRLVFIIVAVIVILGCALLVARALRGDRGKEDPRDVPLRGRVVD